ncbi:hypothetical protein AVEN_154709-1 [Araneus ventricosus]|uniref:Uncharacterized protein n=1 Tax=Araneus ventricosus TaxID=182803 RepID=A0A4Y2U2A9_ARAVE|nr:hypothetical protein AVEN_154709-1 [Araneus ventricosus]
MLFVVVFASHLFTPANNTSAAEEKAKLSPGWSCSRAFGRLNRHRNDDLSIAKSLGVDWGDNIPYDGLGKEPDKLSGLAHKVQIV